MVALIGWLSSHLVVILGVLLAISEALAVLFPADSGFGGILAGLIKFLKGFGAKEPGA